MIIDTEKVDWDVLNAYGYLIQLEFRPNKDGKWEDEGFSVEVDYNKIFANHKCLVEFGDFYSGFELVDNKPSYGKNDRQIESLKGFPIECKSLTIRSFKMPTLDYIPIAESYELSDCEIEKITYPFPKDIEELLIDNNLLDSFDNFPETVGILSIDANKFTTLKGCPIVNECVYIQNEELTDVSDLKGDYNELHLSYLQIDKLPYISEHVRTIELRNLENLDNVDELLNLKKGAKIQIYKCPNIDIYTLYKSGAEITFSDDRGGPMFDLITACRIFGDKIQTATRVEVENRLMQEWCIHNDVTTTKRLEGLIFRTQEINDKRTAYLKSLEVVEKFAL